MSPGDAPPTVEELKSKISEYTRFVEVSLRPQLKGLVVGREEVESEIVEYEQLRSKLLLLQHRPDDETLESLVDMGHEVVFCRAEVDNPKVIFVHVGLGFHPELTLDEAIAVVGDRIKFLRVNTLQTRDNMAKTVARQVESALAILEDLRKTVHEMETN